MFQRAASATTGTTSHSGRQRRSATAISASGRARYRMRSMFDPIDDGTTYALSSARR